ncbi:MAG: prefoldin subunit beta [Nanoarchaeota archaeon]|nr:prefoldin subunit beta [Nanoarchaeota archaeon]
MTPETQEKIRELQNIEATINSMIGQKQQFQSQSMEVENALSHLDSSDTVFRIIGNIMVSSSKEVIKKELEEKREVLALRLKSIEKQEDRHRSKATELQQQVLKEMKKSD